MSILTKNKDITVGQKKIFSLITATILTLVIVTIWYSFVDDRDSQQITKEESNTLSSLSPMQVIKDEFSRTFSNIGDTLSSNSSSSDSISVEIITEDLSATSTENIESTSTIKNI